MTIGLTYDDNLSRVRATGTLPGIVDLFTRSTSNGWGTATTGQSWTVSGTASEYNTNGTVARSSVGSVSVYRIGVLDVNLADLDATVSFRSPVMPTGSSHLFELAGRYADTNNFIAARVELQAPGGVLAVIRKVVTGSSTTLASTTLADPVDAGAWYTVRLQIIGSTFRMKLWRTVDGEPDDWTLATSDAALPGAGDLALRAALAAGNTNTLPVIFEFDNLTVNGDAVLERSLNEITWTTVRGGVNLGQPGTALQVDDYEFEPGVENHYRLRAMGFTDTGSITPAMTAVWLKNLFRPFLNRTVRVIDWGTQKIPSRNGVFPIVGRKNPVAVTDVRLGESFELELLETTPGDAEDMKTRLAHGDPIFLHVPPGCVVPGSLYAVVDDVEIGHGRPDSPLRRIVLPLTEVAAPGPDVVGATMTWQTVINTYATWADLIAAQATWEDVLDGVADPEDVIVP